jgi:hypothetical protein
VKIIALRTKYNVFLKTVIQLVKNILYETGTAVVLLN